MRLQNIPLLAVIVMMIFAATAIVLFALWFTRVGIKNDAPLCPPTEQWAKWENPERNAWRMSQEKQRLKRADDAGQGCYRR